MLLHDLPGRFAKPEEDAENRAARREADTTGPVREGEPRGGMGAEATTRRPRDIVEQDGVAMCRTHRRGAWKG